MIEAQIAGLLLNYRDAARSIRCIHSLLAQGIRPVVVWDNSADNGVSAAAIAASFGDDEDVDLRISPTNLGFAAGVNRGLEYLSRHYSKTWVLLINNDARLLPGAVVRLSAALNKQKGACVAFPDINHAGIVRGPSWCHRYTGLQSWRPHRGFFSYASGCCLLFAPERVPAPLFDEDFFMYGEDCELGWRLGRRPGAVVHVGMTLVEHDGAASSGLGSVFYESHMVAAHLILARKLAKNPLDACFLHVARTAMLIARAVVRVLRFRSLVPLRALWMGAKLAFARRRGSFSIHST